MEKNLLEPHYSSGVYLSQPPVYRVFQLYRVFQPYRVFQLDRVLSPTAFGSRAY
jgi:hypothetical protein